MSDTASLVGIVGGGLGALAFLWRFLESLLAYLHLDLAVEVVEGVDGSRLPTAVVTVENKGRLGKRIHYAALLVGPPRETIGEIAAHFVGSDAQSDTALALLGLFESQPDDDHCALDRRAAVIPLPFFYREQRRIGTETVRQRMILDVSGLSQEAAYRVVLVVCLRYPLGGLRWRTTGDLLAIYAGNRGGGEGSH
ncbi:hypothetical protein ACFWP7_37360 [Streptomyces sp. NPDC058470]|uniref:hypothetical protein n=1 Tax=Streptomyces sp. NPDC058470 TaxID=3346515 RepID=UPI003647070B